MAPSKKTANPLTKKIGKDGFVSSLAKKIFFLKQLISVGLFVYRYRFSVFMSY